MNQERRLPGLQRSRLLLSAHLTGVKLKRLPIPYGRPLELQHRYAIIVASVEQQKARQRAHLAELDTLFASLQSRAFRGDL